MSIYPINITDQTGQLIEIKQKAKRIISLVPSITYTLHRLGLEDEVAGITRFCKFPENWKKTKTIIGGTKDIKIDRIAKLKPDIILANKEENNKEDVEKLREIAPVYVSDVSDLETNSKFIKDLGVIFDKKDTATGIIEKIEKNRNDIKNINKQSAIYLIWREPWMSVGGDTFISQMMEYAGYDNLLKNEKRYPVVEMKHLQNLNPEVVLLCSEPFPFKEKHQMEMQKFFPKAQVMIVEGEAFTWFGAYAEKAFTYFKQLR